jgi:hypothetical protein
MQAQQKLRILFKLAPNMPTRHPPFETTHTRSINHGLPEDTSLAPESLHAEIDDKMEEVKDDYWMVRRHGFEDLLLDKDILLPW